MSELETEPLDNSDATANSWYRPLDPTATSVIEPVKVDLAGRMDQIHQLSLMLHQPEETAPENLTCQRPGENNNRQFSRCPMPEERMTGILTMNGRNLDCRLVEMSIGGFGVVVKRKPSFIPGSVGRFRAPGLNYIVSVTRVEGRPGGAYIGLKQIQEVIDQEVSRHHSPFLGYLIAGISGALIATLAYYFMAGR